MGCREDWSSRLPWVQETAGSSPVAPTSAEGRRFDSCPARSHLKGKCKTGSTPRIHGPLAQMEERLSEKQQVGVSESPGPTMHEHQRVLSLAAGLMRTGKLRCSRHCGSHAPGAHPPARRDSALPSLTRSDRAGDVVQRLRATAFQAVDAGSIPVIPSAARHWRSTGRTRPPARRRKTSRPLSPVIARAGSRAPRSTSNGAGTLGALPQAGRTRL